MATAPNVLPTTTAEEDLDLSATAGVVLTGVVVLFSSLQKRSLVLEWMEA